MLSVRFIHLRVHSAYSLSRGAIKVSELPGLCIKHGIPAVAVTDINNLFGVMDCAKTLRSYGIQHIIGTQATLKISNPWGAFFSQIILIAQEEIGYKNLMALSTLSYQNPTLNTEGAFITIEHLEKYSEGVLCLTGAELGPIGALILQGKKEESEKLLLRLKDIFSERLYIEIMRHGFAVQKTLEPKFLEFAVKHNIPIVATNDVYFSDSSKFEAHDALLCLGEGTYISEENREKSSPNKYFKSQEEMCELFKDLPEALENSVNIAKSCSFLLEERGPILPTFESPSGLSEKEELRKQAEEGLEKRLILQVFPKAQLINKSINLEKLRKQYFDRLNRELDVIEDMGFAGYFLIVSDFIKFAKSRDIPVGPGRGSGSGSLVAWSLTITDVDPIKFELIFERFLNPERISMPDFDIDFCQDRRGEVIEYVLKKYGEDRVAQIITFGKLQARAVLRDVGRVLKMSYGQVDRLCRLIPNNPTNPVTLQEAIEGDELLQNFIKNDETVARLIDIGLQLEGLYRHSSTHAAGIVIGKYPLKELVPLYYDGVSNLAITQINLKYIENAGLLKFDFLGLKTLTVIKNCCDLVKRRGIDINISHIPLDDLKTFELLCRGDALGVFQLESIGIKNVLKKLRPDRIDDLIALVALYRPGPMDDIPKYLARKHGKEKVDYLHPKLEPILKSTYGVIVYQEQVMQTAQTLAKYTLGRADILRRAMGKKNKEEMNSQRKVFISGAVKNGIEEDKAKQIFEVLAKFALYGFNKCHAAPYGLISYQTAYLKANYPLEFFASTASHEKNNIDKMTLLFQNLVESGFKLLPPDINKSENNFVPEEGALRYAMSAIKNVGVGAIVELTREREKNGPFTSIENFASRVNPSCLNKRMLENLIASGAFDCLNQNRCQMYNSVDAILKYSQSFRHEKNSKTLSLFGDTSSNQELPPLRLEKTDKKWNLLERCTKEFEALGFFLSEHPLSMYSDIINQLHLQNSSMFEELASIEGRFIKFAAIILSKDERSTRGGSKFAFLHLSDQFSLFEVPFFSDNYIKIRDIIEPGAAVFVEAMLKKSEDGSFRLVGQSLEMLEEKFEQGSLRIKITEESNVDVLLAILTPLKDDKQGINIELFFEKNTEKLKIKLPGKYIVDQATKLCLMEVEGISLL